MTRSDRSFLDLTALPQLGALLLAARPAWLWSEDGSRILWANGEGLAFFGIANIHALLSLPEAEGFWPAAQIDRLAHTLAPGRPQTELLRFRRSGRIEAVACLCTRMLLGSGDAGLLVADTFATAADEPVEQRARRLLDGLAIDGATVILAGIDGRAVAGSADFEALPDGAEIVHDLASAAGRTGRRSMTLTVSFGEERRPVGIATVHTPDGDFYLVIVGPGERAKAVAGTSPAAAPVPAAPAGAVAIPSAGPAPDPIAIDTVGEPAMPAAAALAPAPIAPEPSVEPPAPTPFANATTVVPPPAAPPLPDPTQVGEPSAEPFAFYRRPRPVQFAFRIDADKRVTYVSPELALVVGPSEASIAGLSWDEVADRLGLPLDNEVARALDRRDTWSGATVYWPVEGTDFAVAADLTGLPSFSRDRSFEGFRGFGFCRTDATRPLTIRAAEDDSEEPAAPASPPDPPEAPSNVVRLLSVPADAKASRATATSASAASPAEPRGEGRAPPPSPPRPPLSGDERDAFRRIAEALRAVMPRRPPPLPEPAAILPPPPEAQTAPSEAIPLSLLDRLPIGIIVFRDHEILYASRMLLDLLGYSDAATLSKAGGVESLLSSAGDIEAPPLPDGRRPMLRASDGHLVAAEARLHIVPWLDRPATMLTVRTQPEVELERRREEDFRNALARIDELEAVLDTATDGVVLLDAGGRVITVNGSAEALFGIESSEILGRPFIDLLAEESHPAALDYLDGLARNGVASVLNDGREVIGKVPSGGLIPLFMTVGRLAGSGKFCVVLRDITHWKNVEGELVSARRAAEQANHHKSDFLAKVSHEIRTPLNAIIGFAEVMLEERFGPIGSDRYRDYLKDIRLSGSHLMSLINDLLDLSKIEAGKLELSPEAVQANDIIQECVALMQPQANRDRIIIRTSLAGSLPRIVADVRSLRQIVLNLLSNAVKFTAAGGQVIVSSAVDDDSQVVIRIRDTGVGMTSKEIETAMKPFRQVGPSSGVRGEGTGLGLPLTKALVEANRASFAIDSEPRKGTMVRVTFPSTRVLAG